MDISDCVVIVIIILSIGLIIYFVLMPYSERQSSCRELCAEHGYIYVVVNGEPIIKVNDTTFVKCLKVDDDGNLIEKWFSMVD